MLGKLIDLVADGVSGTIDLAAKGVSTTVELTGDGVSKGIELGAEHISNKIEGGANLIAHTIDSVASFENKFTEKDVRTAIKLAIDTDTDGTSVADSSPVDAK